MAPEPERETAATLRDLAIVVVTWHSGPDVAALLAGLSDALAAGVELAVVENGSGDETPTIVRQAAPDATLIVNPTNRGFAAAANQGWRATRRPFVLFLNPDTLADAPGLARALRHLARDATIGILGCRTVNSDGTPQPTVDRFHAVSRLALDALRTRRRSTTAVRGTSPATTCDVDWLYGSFLLCRREALEAVAGFDESYEMYGEDLDLCDRVRAEGWRVVYFAETSIMHRGNRSGARRYGADRDLAVLKGTLRWFRRRRGTWHERAFRAAAGCSFAAKALASSISGGGGGSARARGYARMARLCATGDPAARGDRPPVAPRLPSASERASGDRGSDPTLSIVILTWNSRALLESCLAALPAATAGIATEVIVVDNGSVDDTAAVLAAHPELVAIRNARNLGVAPGRNQGIRRARGELVALLDVDTVAAPRSFALLVDHLRAAPRAGIVAPRLIGPDGVLQYSCRRFPTLLDKLGRRLPVRWGRPLTDDVELRGWDHASVREVDYVIGACQVIRASALAEVGLLDERIFYGPEDVDLCLRMQRAGWSVVYVPAAVVMHLERRVTRKLWSMLTARHLQGLGYYFWKHRYLLTRPRVTAPAPAGSAPRRATEPAR